MPDIQEQVIYQTVVNQQINDVFIHPEISLSCISLKKTRFF